MPTKIEIHKILTPSNYYLYKKLTPDLVDEFLIAIQKTCYDICILLFDQLNINCMYLVMTWLMDAKLDLMKANNNPNVFVNLMVDEFLIEIQKHVMTDIVISSIKH